MITEILLEGLTFYAYHGFYEEERKSGNRFSVDVKVKTQLNDQSNFDDLNNTVNYEVLYTIVKSEMAMPSKLLENVGKNILDKIFEEINSVDSAEVSISKFNPSIGGPCDKAKVTLSRVK